MKKSVCGTLVVYLLATSCSTPISSNLRRVGESSSPHQILANTTPSTEAQSSDENPPYFDWPVNEARLTRGFMPLKKRPHLGIDLAAPRGTKILSAHDGMVIYTGRDFRGFGRMVLIESGSGWATLYAHLDKIIVHEGQHIKQGDLLGLMGRSGRATGVHLHFEVRRDKGPVDPLPLLPNGARIAREIASAHPDHSYE